MRTATLILATTALTLTSALAAAATVPLPRDKPPVPSASENGASGAVDPIETAAILPAPGSTETLRSALAAADLRDVEAAMALAADLSPLDRLIVEWVLIRRDAPGLTSSEITAFALDAPGWPTVAIMRRRAESALLRERADPAAVVSAFGASQPISEAGMLALARAHLALGDEAAAAAVVAPYWRSEVLEPDEERRFLGEFGDLLSRDDHKAHYDVLMYADRVAQAATLAARLGDGYVALAEARAAVLRRENSAGRLLDALPEAVRDDPLYVFTQAEHARYLERYEEAAEILRDAPTDPALLVDPESWWIERRIVSRHLMEVGDGRGAYELAAAHRGGDAEIVAEARFHAGWYALRFMDDPAAARPEFEALLAVATRAQSRSRAFYWLARTEEAAGNAEAAAARYREAAAYTTVFYGQLARAALGETTLGLPPPPEPTDADRESFAANLGVRALARLVEAGYTGDAAMFYPELARRLATPGEIALLAAFAERRGDPRTVLQVGRIAADRGMPVEALAYPLDAIPAHDRGDGAVEMALVYAIARQESAFDPAAVSSAGALGLLQLMPGTARLVAADMGLAYSQPQLTSDPGYNARLGAAHLRELVNDYGGSYIMTFAGYNAGPGRVREWVARFGDPRDPDIDPIDWIEQISYGETRNYVQRVTENLQVYRDRLGQPTLRIVEDLARGR